MEQFPADGSEDRRKRLSTITEYSESAFDSDNDVSSSMADDNLPIPRMKMETELENEHFLMDDSKCGAIRCVKWAARKRNLRRDIRCSITFGISHQVSAEIPRSGSTWLDTEEEEEDDDEEKDKEKEKEEEEEEEEEKEEEEEEVEEAVTRRFEENVVPTRLQALASTLNW
ncbi:hypothetical protein HZH66_004189 [Vespula vulgaris]|uniref:Uncharacterized protein n=1 Tax=Vespula vulgaris TaxID=7454 RepID=A0A834KEH3_VESVU|nr:hypothetical protein HZH66_004189 [Vespula vulgaris]